MPTQALLQHGLTGHSISPKRMLGPHMAHHTTAKLCSKKVFLLGPSHHLYLDNCALSQHTFYSTPIGDLPLDKHTISELRATGDFQDLTASQDAAEHSLEMHLPFIYHQLSKSSAPGQFPPLVPIMVGSTSKSSEEHFGAMLAPYLADPSNVFVISSDFCHWGSRFNYTYYMPTRTSEPAGGVSLRKGDSPSDPPIYDSIGRVDHMAMEAITSGSHDQFLTNLRKTKNTVCGRHPIGIIMAAIEQLKRDAKLSKEQGIFHFVRYERSSEVEEARDSSVSYASAFAVM